MWKIFLSVTLIPGNVGWFFFLTLKKNYLANQLIRGMEILYQYWYFGQQFMNLDIYKCFLEPLFDTFLTTLPHPGDTCLRICPAWFTPLEPPITSTGPGEVGPSLCCQVVPSHEGYGWILTISSSLLNWYQLRSSCQLTETWCFAKVYLCVCTDARKAQAWIAQNWWCRVIQVSGNSITEWKVTVSVRFGYYQAQIIA